MKTHFSTKVPYSTIVVAACGQKTKRLSEAPNRVDCLNCRKRDAFILAEDEQKSRRYAAFMAQTPREYSEPWREVTITCQCGSTLFRIGDRTCYGHYDNFHCSECGNVESRLTETGMNF